MLAAALALTGMIVVGQPLVAEDAVRAHLATPIGSAAREDAMLRALWEPYPRGKDRETQARFAYYRLEALRRTSRAAGDNPAAGSFFASLAVPGSPVLGINDMLMEYSINRDFVVAVQAQFAGTVAADDLAWFASEVGWGGECQDHLACPVIVLDDTVGRYLRAHPSGRHTDSAMQKIGSWLDFKGREPFSLDPGLPRRETCDGLASALTALRGAVVNAVASNKDRALAPIQQLEAACR